MNSSSSYALVGGYTLIELMICICILGILALTAMNIASSTPRAAGYAAAADLRQIWIIQKNYLVDSMQDPFTAPNPSTYTLNLLAPNRNFLSLSTGTISANVMPPTHSLDGTVGDERKTSPTTGDGIYDVGRQY